VNDIHPEQISRQRQGSQLATSARRSDLHGHASLLAKGKRFERYVEACADCPRSIAWGIAFPLLAQTDMPTLTSAFGVKRAFTESHPMFDYGPRRGIP